MSHVEPFTPATMTRQVFPAWSVDVPESFAETFDEEASYWHAWDAHRSVSMSSFVLSDDRGPVSARRIARRLPDLDGSPVDELPPGVIGRATTAVAAQPARAERVLTGMLAAPGRALVVTITADDLEWARQTWLSIRTYPAPIPPLARRRPGHARRQKRQRS